MLDGLELPLVQSLEGEAAEALQVHGVPALEGDFLQDLGRRATRFRLAGVLAGTDSAAALKTLREKHRAAAPVAFVADIATATRIDRVLIEELEARELAGRPERTEFKLSLVEYLPAPAQPDEPPPPPPPPKPVPLVAALEVTVIVDGDPGFDFSQVVVQVAGAPDGGAPIAIVLTDRTANVWTDKPMPPGAYTASASVTTPPLSGSVDARVTAGQTTRVTIHLRQGPPVAHGFVVHYWFDKALIEPCLRSVLRRVAAYATAHADEKMLIVGYTDLVGATAYNQSLSERRARGVFAYLTAGRDHDKSVAEWDALRRGGAGTTRLGDNWGVREYQQMLSGLKYYAGQIDEQHGPLTDAAVRNFQSDHALPVTGIVDDATWLALIDAYLSTDALAVPQAQFFPNCQGDIVKWLGSDEQDPVRNTEDAWRPNRRSEIVFVRAGKLPGPIAKPVTFDLPTPGAVNVKWCAGSDTDPVVILSHGAAQPNTFLVQPAEPGSLTVTGRMTTEGGAAAGGVRYVLTAPDGEYLDGERKQGPDRGRPIPGTTQTDGSFGHATPTPVGVYILSVLDNFTVRLASDPANSGSSPVLCVRLDGSQDLDVVLAPADGVDPRRKLTASVVDRSFVPLAATAVALTFPDGSSDTATTDAQGRFTTTMTDAFKTVNLRYQAGAGPNDAVQLDYFIDAGDIATADGVSRRLHNLGYAPEANLADAVAAFQATQGINPTGATDDNTRTRLNAVYGGDTPLFPVFDDTPQPVAPNPLSTDP
jgi:peptidoglycan hydrolase-like protein with peptidoglycan-binding domain